MKYNLTINPRKSYWPKKKGVRQYGQTRNIIGIYSYCVLDRPVLEWNQVLLHPEQNLSDHFTYLHLGGDLQSVIYGEWLWNIHIYHEHSVIGQRAHAWWQGGKSNDAPLISLIFTDILGLCFYKLASVCMMDIEGHPWRYFMKLCDFKVLMNILVTCL